MTDIGQLREVVQHRYEHYPFYQELYGEEPELRDIEAFRSLPTVTKDELREASDGGTLLATIDEDTVGCGTTSGTSGDIAAVLRTRTDRDERIRDIYSQFIDAYFPEQSRTLALMSVQWAANDVVYNLRDAGRFVAVGDVYDLGQGLQLAQKVEATHLFTTPSLAVRFGEALQDSDMDATAFDRIVMGGELLSATIRDRLEELFPEAALAQTYGSRETSSIGYQCPQLEASNRYHVLPEHHHIEVIDPETGDPVPDGDEGEVTVTTLWTDTGMPFTRYRTGDRGRITAHACDCGQDGSVLDMRGRMTFDSIKLRGLTVYRAEFEEALQGVSGLVTGTYQIHVHESEHEGTVKPWLRVMLQPRTDISRKETFRQTLEQRLMAGFQVTEKYTWQEAVEKGQFLPIEVELVDDLGEGSKLRRVIDHRSEPVTSNTLM